MWKTNNSIDDSKWRKKNEQWRYLAVKKLSALLHGIASKHKGDFYCLNCLHSFRAENNLKSHGKICNYKDFCGSMKIDKLLEFNQYMKSDKLPYIIYADIESLITKIEGCANNAENSSTAKIGEHIPWGYSMSTIWSFDHIENKHIISWIRLYENFLWIFKRTHEKYNWLWKGKRMLTLTKEELKSHQEAKACYICGKRILKELSKSVNYRTFRDHCHYTGKYGGVAHCICNLKLNVSIILL